MNTELENAIAIDAPYRAMVNAIREGHNADYEVVEFFKAVNKFEGGGSLNETIDHIEQDMMEELYDAVDFEKEVKETYYAGQTGCRTWPA